MIDDTGVRVILNGAALAEDFVPPELPARQAHTADIHACLSPALAGRKPTHVWLHGRSGCGKTVVARTCLTQLRRSSALPHVAVNCWERDTLYEILDQIIRDLRIFRAEERRITVKLDRLQRYLGQGCLLILLDEVDKIAPAERSRVLYSLDALGRTGLICISDGPYAPG